VSTGRFLPFRRLASAPAMPAEPSPDAHERFDEPVEGRVGEPRFHRMLPDPEPITAAQATAGLALGERARTDRPYLVLNMVATADGRVTVAGRAGPLGSAADHALFHQLRLEVDAVMVGAGTARIEHYGRLVRDPEHRARRRANGLAADPLGCLVSQRLDLPPSDVPLLADPQSTVVVITAADREIEGAGARVEYLRSPGATVDLPGALRTLRTRYDVRSLLCEGGPTLNATLLALGLVDELFLSLAPKLAGGLDPLTIVSGPSPADPLELELVSVLESGGYLFLRYAVGGR
jgi:riboflavin-specific deaminase-like protein